MYLAARPIRTERIEVAMTTATEPSEVPPEGATGAPVNQVTREGPVPLARLWQRRTAHAAAETPGACVVRIGISTGSGSIDCMGATGASIGNGSPAATLSGGSAMMFAESSDVGPALTTVAGIARSSMANSTSISR